jgi:IS6 family transposase
VFTGFRFPPEVIVLAVRWYVGSGSRIALSRSCSPSGGRGRPCHLVPVGAALHSAPRRRRPAPSPRGRRPLVRRRDLREARRTWRYVYRAIDQHGQIVDVYGSARRDTLAARRSFTTVLGSHGTPGEVVTDRAWTMLAVVDELMPTVFHNTVQYANNRIEAITAGSKPGRGRCVDANVMATPA